MRPHSGVLAQSRATSSTEIKVDLPQPRSRVEPAFRDLVERIYVALTARPAAPPRASRRIASRAWASKWFCRGHPPTRSPA